VIDKPVIASVSDQIGPRLPAHPLIVIADDHAAMRSRLRLLLDAEEEFEVIAEAATIQSVFVHVCGQPPTLLMLDLNVPGARASMRSEGSQRSRSDTA
jgi:DNA-binding NarL/FixJ family response regulator